MIKLKELCRNIGAILVTNEPLLILKIATYIAITVDCIQEFTGEYPPETPYTPGSPLPPIRRRVRTAFEFSEFIINGENDKVL